MWRWAMENLYLYTIVKSESILNNLTLTNHFVCFLSNIQIVVGYVVNIANVVFVVMG